MIQNQSNQRVFLILGYGPIAAHIVNHLVKLESPIIHIVTERPINSDLHDNISACRPSNAEELIRDTTFDVIMNCWRCLPPSNLSIRRNLLTKLANSKSKNATFLNFSTVAVYGDRTDVHTELSRAEPVNQYGREKLEIEKFVGDLGFRRVTNLRISNVFGDLGLRDVVNKIIMAKVDNSILTLTEPSIIFRDFIHIHVLVEFVSKLTCNPPDREYENINVATGRSKSLLELFEVCNYFFNGSLTYSIANVKPDEIRVSRLDVSKLQTIFDLDSNAFRTDLLNYLRESQH
jgi:nucleoside-diphosphate-sugar epimerase